MDAQDHYRQKKKGSMLRVAWMTKIQTVLNLPRKPNPADIPPNMLRTIHSRSSLSSSRIPSTCVNKFLLLCAHCKCLVHSGRGFSGLGIVEVGAGSQIVSSRRRKSFVRDEQNKLSEIRDNLYSKKGDQSSALISDGLEGVIPEFSANARDRGLVGIKCGLKDIPGFHEKTTGRNNPPVKGNRFYMQQ